MAITAPPNPGSTPSSAPIGERFDRASADRKSGGTDRPGFDLGGASENDRPSRDSAASPAGTAIPDGPATPSPGEADPTGRGAATGMTVGDARSLGGTAGGSRPGEATRGTAGAVRPPQTVSADQTFTQGNPDDAV